MKPLEWFVLVILLLIAFPIGFWLGEQAMKMEDPPNLAGTKARIDTVYILVPIPTYIFHQWKLDGKQFQSLSKKQLNNLLRYGRIE